MIRANWQPHIPIDNQTLFCGRGTRTNYDEFSDPLQTKVVDEMRKVYRFCIHHVYTIKNNSLQLKKFLHFIASVMLHNLNWNATLSTLNHCRNKRSYEIYTDFIRIEMYQIVLLSLNLYKIKLYRSKDIPDTILYYIKLYIIK